MSAASAVAAVSRAGGTAGQPGNPVLLAVLPLLAQGRWVLAVTLGAGSDNGASYQRVPPRTPDRPHTSWDRGCPVQDRWEQGGVSRHRGSLAMHACASAPPPSLDPSPSLPRFSTSCAPCLSLAAGGSTRTGRCRRSASSSALSVLGSAGPSTPAGRRPMRCTETWVSPLVMFKRALQATASTWDVAGTSAGEAADEVHLPPCHAGTAAPGLLRSADSSTNAPF